MIENPLTYEDFDEIRRRPAVVPPTTLDALVEDIRSEVARATAAWPPFNSAHEGYAVILEELDELKEHVWTNQKRRDLHRMRAEAIQVAAMAIRFALELCDDERGRK